AVLTEFEGAVQRVGRFLIVVEHELAADGAGFGGELHAQAPASDIDFVNALVAQVAIAVGPIPVPVVVEAVFLERHLLRRALPQVVIHIGRRIADRFGTDGVAPLVAQAAREVDVADQAFAHLPHAVLQRRRGAALAALLHHPVILARRRHNLFGLEDIVRARLLDVDILAGAAGVDGHQGVPVIGRGDGDGVDRLVFEELAIVPVNRRFLLGDGLDAARRRVQHVLVDVAERHQLYIGLAGDLLDVVLAAAAQADGGYSNGVVRAAENGVGGGGRGGEEEISSVHGFRYRYSSATLSHRNGGACFRLPTPALRA